MHHRLQSAHGGVDLMDQQLSYYSLTQRRTLKWWKKVFWHLIDITVMNSWIILRSNNPESSIDTQLKYRIELCRQLVQPLLNLKASPQCPPLLCVQHGRRPLAVLKRLTGKHRAASRGRCIVCYRKKSSCGKRKDTKSINILSEM